MNLEVETAQSQSKRQNNGGIGGVKQERSSDPVNTLNV